MARPLRVAVLGDGPAGLWVARRLTDLLGSDASVVLHGDLNRADGLGIVLEHSFVSSLNNQVPAIGSKIIASATGWDRVTVRVDGRQISASGHRIHGIDRGRLLRILRAAATDAGVLIRSGRYTARDVPENVDLLIVAEGAGSTVRTALSDAFGTRIRPSPTWHVWASTRCGEVRPGFVFLRTFAGCLVAHTYPFEQDRSTMVVEGTPATIRRLGLADVSGQRLGRRLTELFRTEVPGIRFDPVRQGFRAFRSVTNQRWFVDRTVLIGDAAHVTHFSIGSGTTLAIEDGEALAEELVAAPSLPEALRSYQERRAVLVESMQLDARASEEWFATAEQHVDQDPYLLMFALRTRRDLTSYAGLCRRDPDFLREVVRAMTTGQATTGQGFAHPSELPLRLAGGAVLPCRVLLTRTDRGLPAGSVGLSAVPHGALNAVLVSGGAVAGQHAEEVRQRRGGLPVGIFLPDTDARGLPDAEIGSWDFVVTTIAAGQPRVLASATAARWRNEMGCVVGVDGSALARDELETLIAGGRIDFAVTGK